MIAQISGQVVGNTGNSAVIMTPGGVGYRLAISPRAAEAAKVGQTVTLQTALIVRDDALELFGFADSPEREFFGLCISVSGVGPKIALHLLELGTVAEISAAIARGDVGYLTRVSGIGKKTAERLVVELKSKIGEVGFGAPVARAGDAGGLLGDVVEALTMMGYSPAQAREAAKKLNSEGKTSEQLLREALRLMK